MSIRWTQTAVAAALLILGASAPARAQGLSGFLSPGPLAEPHAALDGLTKCTKCHTTGKGVSAGKCLDCHDDVAAQVRSKRGFHADKGASCQPCHLDHRGRDYRMVTFSAVDFDHDPTGFPLGNGHAVLPCVACHRGEGWAGLNPACTACHADPHGGEASRGVLSAGCTACHTDETWRALPLSQVVFDHNQRGHAAFALDGAHAQVDCVDCHERWRFVPTAHDACTSCHKDPHRAPFSDDCATCHTVRTDWRVPRFAHAVTGFLLEGVHKEAPCSSCHRRGVTHPVPHETCETCHKDPHGGQFAPRPCDDCHSVTRKGFALTGFDHAAVGWPLEGRHAEATCEACHGEGSEASYAAVSRACGDCHKDPHQARFAPDPCDACHTPMDWQVEVFDHGRTDFALTGAHDGLDCAGCHTSGAWAGLEHDSCVDCHEDARHGAALGPETCSSCHETVAWANVRFDHAQTDFALPPQHTQARCADCHDPVRFIGLDATCVSCHDADRPDAHFPGPCDDCHRARSWQPADLGPEGHAATGFALVGTHALLACANCHAPDLPRGAAPTDCVGCHATDDVHRNLLGNACADCHTERGWVRTRWRHQLSGWPLRGAHRLAACDDCHAAGYVGTPTDCRQCHLVDAPLSVPAHASPFFSACDHCHKPYTWVAPRYAH